MVFPADASSVKLVCKRWIRNVPASTQTSYQYELVLPFPSHVKGAPTYLS